jgi:mannose-1-phosphate guanylyltransferase/phosphomannomutase
VSLVADVVPGPEVAVPVNVTHAVERMLHGTGRVSRTAVWGTSLMEVASAGGVTFAGTPDGGCIWPDFLPAYDAAVTLAKLLDLLAVVDHPLSAVVGALPRIHVAHETVVTPWERKGTVMREILERPGGPVLDLADGVKIGEDDEWALVLPDPEEALTHVWAESGDGPGARRRAREYAERVRRLLS